MTTKSDIQAGIASAVRASWLPMLIIALAQIQMGFNVSALPVSIGGIVEDFNTSPSSVSTALVVYSLAVAGFEGGWFTGRVPLTSIRMPLRDFQGVNLAEIRSINLLFDQTPSGTLFMSDIEVVR
jgi:hypothetical protein